MRAVSTALQPSTVSHSRPPARARRAARCPARCTDATPSPFLADRPTSVGQAEPPGTSPPVRQQTARLSVGIRPAATVNLGNRASLEAAARVSPITRTVAGVGEPRKRRARGRTLVAHEHALVDSSRHGPRIASSNLRPRAGGVDGGLRGDECPQPLGLGAPTRQLVSLRWSHGGRDTPSAPAPLGRVDPRRTPAAVSGPGPAAQASTTPPRPFLGERGAACRRPARRAMFPTVLHRSPSRVPRQVRDQLGVLPRDFLAAPARRVLRTPGRSRTDAVDGGARVAGRHRRGGNPEWAGCPPGGPARGASALAVVDPAAGRLARTTGGPHEVTAGRTGTGVRW